MARDLAVLTVMGTDFGSPGMEPGASLRQEMLWWLQAGFSGEEILAATTGRGAALLGRATDLGALMPGRMAFMVGLPIEETVAGSLLHAPRTVGRPAQIY